VAQSARALREQRERIRLALASRQCGRFVVVVLLLLRQLRSGGVVIGLPRGFAIAPGATLAAIAKKLPELGLGARVLGFNYDTGERYLSVEGFLPTEG
jgi:hypothetical protein